MKFVLEGKILKSKGLFLWAVELSFMHPVLKNQMNIKIDEAPKFKSLLIRERRRWEKYK